MGVTAALGLGSSLLGGILGGGQKTTTQTNNSTQTSTPNEPGYFSQFRQSLIPQFQHQLAQANQPVYGQAQQSQYLNSLNGLASSSIKQLGSSLASKGGSLNSGAYGQGITSILQGRAGKLADYNSQVPMLNRQAQQQGVNSLLGLGMNFAGHAPVGNTTTSSGTQTTKSGGGIMNNIGTMLGGAGGFLTGKAYDQGQFGSIGLNPMGNGDYGNYQGPGASASYNPFDGNFGM